VRRRAKQLLVLREGFEDRSHIWRASGEPDGEGRPASPEAEAEGTCRRIPPKAHEQGECAEEQNNCLFCVRDSKTAAISDEHPASRMARGQKQKVLLLTGIRALCVSKEHSQYPGTACKSRGGSRGNL